MAKTTIRSTYALDVETVRALDRMARRLRISKSEALRRAIKSAAGQTGSAVSEPVAAIVALDQLQASLRLSRGQAVAWTRRSRAERRSASTRREPRRG